MSEIVPSPDKTLGNCEAHLLLFCQQLEEKKPYTIANPLPIETPIGKSAIMYTQKSENK